MIHSKHCDAPWLMLIHGLFGSLDNLSMLRRALEQDFQILSIDLPDHGKSAHSEMFSYEAYAQRLMEVVEHLGIEKISLLGHSLGGKVAMTMALANAVKIDKLVVLDIAPVAYSPRHQNVLEGLGRINLGILEGRQQADAILGETIKETGVRQFLLKSLFKDEKGWQWRFNLSLLQRDYHLISASISPLTAYEGPALFIKGENSDYLKAQHRPAVIALFPNSIAKIISGTGHWLHAEKPVICGRMVSDFLLD